MYVYLKINNRWTVGFFNPDHTFVPESDHDTAEKAARRTHWLNGGSDEPIAIKPKCAICGYEYGHTDLCIENGSRCRQALRIMKSLINYDMSNMKDKNILQALNTVEDILKQKGCKHLGGDGTLTSLMDVVIYG